ncbi:MAG TPA: ATP-dependent DNA helicase [Solirubrobacterales bacterium]|nr:ATP-dependent DNA helicase [Solirubrobacterales bacterium]
MQAEFEPGSSFRDASAHRDGPALVVGRTGTGRSELLARRFAALVAEGVDVEQIAVLTRGPAASRHLRQRVESLLSDPYEELWVQTWAEFSERLLRDYALEAGIDPFFEVAAPADRLAILLERLDELPLRRHEIRGNPAGLLARLLERIDVLKGEGVGPAELRDHSRAAERGATSRSEREAALRELEFADLFERHDAVMRERGAIDEPELTLELGRLLQRRADVAAAIGERFLHVMVDELEDAGRARTALLEALAPHRNVLAVCDPDQGLGAFRVCGEAAAVRFGERFPDAAQFRFGEPVRGRGGPAAVAGAIARLVPDSYRDVAPAPAGGPDEVRDAGSVRLWRCANERAQAQAVAREVEQLLASGQCAPEQLCVITGPAGREGRLVAAALEERNVPFRSGGSAAFFHRPEVRDVIAWLRALADPGDSSAVVRALTRPPVELRSVDLARCTTIARRRKLDMISAVEAALESPQLPPPSRDRIRAFLKLYRSAARALDGLRADVFVRRLIERIGFRRHGLFAASPETAERLVNLAGVADLAGSWTRRRPDGSTREFVRYLSAVAEAGQRFSSAADAPPVGAVLVAEPGQLKGLEFERVYLLGLEAGSYRGGSERAGWIDDGLLDGGMPALGPGVAETLGLRRAYVAAGRACEQLVLSYPEEVRGGAVGPSSVYRAAADLGAEEEPHAEELFGPAEGLHSTYRMVRDEVLEYSWRAGAALSEMRLDTPDDVNRAVARFLELLKLSALIQRPEGESEQDSLAALNELLSRVGSPEQLAELERSALDRYILEEAGERAERREHLAKQSEPGLEAFLPRRGDGLGLSASDIDLYRTCPLKYKFARVFAIPQEPTINQRFGILIHQVLDRYHSEELRGFGGAESDGSDGIGRLLALFEAGWRRQGFGSSDDELQYRDRAVAALARYHERHTAGAARPVWLERAFSFNIGEHSIRGRIDRVDRHPDGALELIDYKTGAPKRPEELTDDVQIPLYRIGVREAWGVDAADGSYWYVLDDEKVPVAGEADDLERVERTVLEVAAGIDDQDFEPRPSFENCSWCDYRLICPASEA